MAERTAEIDVDGTPEDVWALVGDFGGIAGWMPGMESCRVEGENRILETMGMTITEKLLARDDATMAITYAIVDGVPIESHQATITVTAAGAGSHVTWVVDAAPDDMADLMQGVYQASLEAVKANVEG
jgi:carbon monoxide dehydrogenase subunit G